MSSPSRVRELAEANAAEIVLSQSRGEAVKGLRTKAGLTQEEVAELLETSRERVSRVENGHVSPSVEFVDGLAKAVALAELVREMQVKGELDTRGVRRSARELGLDREDVDMILINSLSSLDEKRRGLIEELEGRG